MLEKVLRTAMMMTIFGLLCGPYIYRYFTKLTSTPAFVTIGSSTHIIRAFRNQSIPKELIGYANNLDEENFESIPFAIVPLQNLTRMANAGMKLSKKQAVFIVTNATNPSYPFEELMTKLATGKVPLFFVVNFTVGIQMSNQMQKGENKLELRLRSKSRKMSEDFSKLLVVTGQAALNMSITSEVIDLTDSGKSCENLAEYPEADIIGAIGGFLDGPIVCGGAKSDQAIKKCFSYTSTGRKWDKYQDMFVSRKNAASLVLNNTTLLVVGGKCNKMEKQFCEGSSEMFASTHSKTIRKSGPNVSPFIDKHCLVSLAPHRVLVVGGSDAPNPRIYDFQANSWSKGPKLKVSGYYLENPACGSLSDPVTGKRYILVTGGMFYPGNDLTKKSFQSMVQILDMSQDKPQWLQPVVELPTGLSGQSVVSVGANTLFLVGGQGVQGLSGQILKITVTNGKWGIVKLPQQLKVARSNMVAMMIPDKYTTCN